MTPQETADRVARVIEQATDRITGIGAEQYADTETQLFERLPLPKLVDYQIEEWLDIVNYAAFMVIKLELIKQTLEGHNDAVVVPRRDLQRIVDGFGDAAIVAQHPTASWDDIEQLLHGLREALKEAH